MTRVKGIVLETSNNRATILTDQGEFKKVKISQPVQTGEIWQESPMLVWKYACAAAVLLMLIAGGVDFFSVTAYAEVSSDVELGLNRWDRVISVKVLNSNSKQIIGSLNLKGKKVEEAVGELAKSNLGNSDKKKPMITVVTKKPNSEEVKQRIKEKVNTKVKGAIDKKQPTQNQVKSKPNESNGSSGNPSHSSPEKGSIKYKEKTNNWDNPELAPSTVVKDETDTETILLPSLDNANKVNNHNKDKNMPLIKENNLNDILRSAPLENSSQLLEEKQKNNSDKSNNDKQRPSKQEKKK
ncbi:MAG: anti-sigma factor domain-containing protein [Syntrophomonas sp.]